MESTSKGSDPAYILHDALLSPGRSFIRRGTRKIDGRAVILKMLPVNYLPQHIERLKKEYALGKRLDLDSILKTLCLEHIQGVPTLVTEDFGGVPLRLHLGGLSLKPEAFLKLAIPITAALADLHRCNVAHFDLKPENILVDPVSGVVKLCDLGLASPLPCPRPTGKSAWTIEGTLPYMSPERTGRMNLDLDSRSDLYSLGVTFFEMLTGRLPFQAADPLEWIHCHIAKAPPPPLEFAPSLPPSLSALVLKLLEKDPTDRYQSARGLGYDLEACLELWKSSGKIESLTLGKKDIPDRLQLPQKLYGREKEIALLIAACERMSQSGVPELALVGGYSGIGKSSLVNELHRPMASRRGLFVGGKFDQNRQDIPYATVVRAFTDLMFGILAESEERIAAWKGKMQAALGSNGRLITNLIPPVELLIGVQAPVLALPPPEAQNRFIQVFRDFIGVFAQDAHPLTLFLDDLQWADTASMGLLKELLLNPEARHLFVVGAYRDNEVSPTHPLMATIKEARKAGLRIFEVELKPMERRDLIRFLAETLRRKAEEIGPFADLIMEKTGGNPFFTRQFLTTLYEDGLLTLDSDAGNWIPDITGIRAHGFTDNVVEFMVGKLKRLPEGTLSILKYLACIGPEARSAVLSWVSGRPVVEVEELLEESLRAGLIRSTEGAFAFAHDRIQEAAYSMIPQEARAVIHLHIGRSLLSKLTEHEIVEGVFALVDQLNPGAGAGLITDPAELETLSRLNVLAGRKAKSSAAYAAARGYLTQARALQPEDAWTASYGQTTLLHLDLMECEYLAGDFESANASSRLLLEQAQSDLDRAKVYSLRMRLYQLSGAYEEAINTGFEALLLFGVGFPETDESFRAAVEKEQRDIPVNMRGRSIAGLFEAPEAADPVIRTVIGLLVDLMPCVAAVRPGSKLYLLLVLKTVNLSLRHGNIGKACYSYFIYGRTLVTEVQHVEAGMAFAEMALQSIERSKDMAPKGTMLFLHGVYLHHWRQPISTGISILEQAFATCVETGNYVYASLSAFFLVTHTMEQADSLDEVFRISEKYLDFARRIRNDVLYQALSLYLQVAGEFKEPAQDERVPPGVEMSESERFTLIAKARFAPCIAGYHILRQRISFLFGRYSDAEASGASAVKAMANGGVAQASYYFYHALSLIALQRDAGAENREKTLEALKAPVEKLKFMAENSPQNYSNRHMLVCAELAGLQGRLLEAEQGYELAIQSARENGFLMNQALAQELAGGFHLRRGLETVGYAYLREARQSYLRWGANGKARALERLYPRLREQHSFSQTLALSVGTAEIDVLSVIKASQAISGEIILDKLLGRLGQVLAEYAGARKGAVLLHRGGNLAVGVESVLDGEGALQSIVPSPPMPLESATSLPASIIKFVARTGQSVLLDDATANARFSRDEYIVRNRSKSIFCLPIMRQTELVAVVCLENDLVVGAFTPDRIQVLEVLAAQAAVSLDNARLYDDLKRENGERRRAEERFSTVFHSSPAPMAVLRMKDNAFVDINEAYLKALGYSREEILGRSPVEIGLVDTESSTDRKPVTGGDGGLLLEEVVIRSKSGGARVMLTSMETIDLAGEACVMSASVDITERMQVEEQLRQSQKMEALGCLVGGVAHDFNNMLMAINGYSEIALMKTDPGHYAYEALQEILEAGERASGLTRQLLAYSRNQVLAPKIWHLNSILSGLEKMLARLIGENISLAVSPSARKDLIEADRGQIEQVLMNLVVNARDAMPQGGALTVETSEVQLDEAYAATHIDVVPGEYVVLAVTDTGTGMSPEIQQRIFEPFFTTKEVGKGTGLGLAVVYGIVKQSRGSIAIQSEVGKGTTFRIHFPCFDSRPETGMGGGDPVTTKDYRGDECVLMVDDDAQVGRVVAQGLRELGYRVLLAENGMDALTLAEQNGKAIRIVLTDLVMPKIGGQTLARYLDNILPDIPVLFMSGYPNEMEVSERFLPKPFTAAELAKSLRNLLDKTT